MKKLLISILLFLPFNIYALDIPELVSEKVLVYDLTDNQIIYEKNSEVKTSIASLTKIITSMVAIEKINDLDSKINITSKMLDNIYWNASVAKLKIGDIVTYRDLLYALLLPSGADAAQALAISLSGSTNKYVLEMNEFAQRIGMANSHFVNITGLDTNGQYSTLKDVLVLLKYALNNPTFKEIFTTKEYILTNNLEVKSTIKSYEEKYNIDISRIIGSKTGTTDEAGLCLASYFFIQNHEILAITTNAPLNEEYPQNLIDSLKIINYLDQNYKIIKESIKEEQIIPSKKEKSEKSAKTFLLIILFSILTILSITNIINFYKSKIIN